MLAFLVSSGCLFTLGLMPVLMLVRHYDSPKIARKKDGLVDRTY